jgi:cytochrome c oxidase subunit 2
MQRQPVSAESQEMAGSEIFALRGCGVCHSIAGTDHRGELGPDLTHFANRTTLASGILNSAEPNVLEDWLRDPPALKPGSKMPNLTLIDSDVQALAAYLRSLK